ncbi:MAG: S-layer homology domain-containing protein [Acutalibacter muris]|nr:S-layer homology domain-containing protein [Acutalibacter muris]
MLKLTKKLIKRTVAMVLCALLLLGAVPLDLLPGASAASWADPYMDRLKQYGVMVGGRPNDRITRAEMAAVLNRAFGFRRTGPIPFTDVSKKAWYYNDIVVSYNEGILSGTSRTTASPKAAVTREQALALLGRCLRYQENAGEVTDFTDGKNFSNWSSIYVRSALLAGIISSTSGNFRPKSAATRGEIAVMLSKAMGELVSSSGVTELGGVFGNVTVNAPNVTLRNTTIAGDLYLTGGVGLGNVILDNVKVLGRIIVAGGGEGESGEASVLLNNVTARQLVVDPATGQYVSLRALGNTDIPETLVRSNAYIQDDVRNNNMGLRKVIFEEPPEGKFTIAGNMKDVTNKAPGSHLIVGDTGTGSVTKITVDEEAVNSFVDLEINASVDDIKLDTSATITGTGDIGHIDVGANGCTSEILPDTLTVRPGVVTEIAGMTGIDSEKAKELSQEPRLLEGYPKAKNIAPTSADAYFSTNKAGTLYWALTDNAKGPLTDADVETLVEQPAYGSGFRKMGTIDIDSSKKEFLLPITELTQGGTYYISATLVDAHGRRSHVKSQRITTPDGTVPAMASRDYPSITDATPTRNEENAGWDFSEIANLQATVMANKSCDLYYVLLAAGSTAPSTGELLSAAFPSPYGYGRLHLIKNTLDSFKVTEIDMDLDGTPDGLGQVKEKTSYDLYYWLTDANGEQSSQVQKVTVTTKDVTPPEFTMGEMFQSDTKATSVTLSNTVDEDATVYWVAVPSGDPYPKADPEVYPNTDPWREFLKTEAAKIQVAAGVGTSQSQAGKVNAKANTQFNITISRLQPESAYDVYYVAQDSANNYSQVIGMYTAHTLDETPPSASLRFESYPAESPETPYAYSTIDVVFSEAIRYRQPANAPVIYSELRLIELYNKYRTATPADKAKAEEEYVGALRDTIILCDSSGQAVPVRDWDQQSDRTDWVVDYRNVQVLQDGKNMVVSFVNDPSEPSKSALNLESGAQYFFHLQNITDDSQSRNQMGEQDMDAFTTVSARVGISKLDDLDLNAFKIGRDENGNPITSDEPVYVYNDINNKRDGTDKISADIAFTADPRSTGTAANGVKWDMIFWFDRDVEFMLFTRIHGDENSKWVPVGVDENGDPGILKITVPATAKNYAGVSVIKNLTSNGTSVSIPQYHDINEPYTLGMLDGGLNDATENQYDFALYFTKVGDRTDRSSFDQLINGQVTFVTGGAASLRDFRPANVDSYNNLRQGKTLITDITWPNKDSDLLDPRTRLLTKQFEDGREPVLVSSYPRFSPTSSGVTAWFALNTPGTIHYVLAPQTAGGENFVVTPQKNNASGRAENISYDEILEKIPECGINGPIGHQYTMASNLSIMERMFPDDFTIPSTDANGNEISIPNPDMAAYKFDSPITTNVTNVDFSDVSSDDLVHDSLEANKAEKGFKISGLRADTEYLMYLVTTTGNSDIYSPVTVYRFKTLPMVKPTITTQATGANATINTDQNGTNLVYKLIPYDSTMNQAFRETFATGDHVTSVFDLSYRGKPSSKYVGTTRINYEDSRFTVLDAMLETVTVDGKQQSLFDRCASESLKESIANLIDGTVADGASSLGKVENTIDDSINFMCDEVWTDMGDSTYCLIAYGYCGTKTNMSDKSFSAIQPINKRKEQIQVTIGNGLDYDPDTKQISGTLSFAFTDALHFFNTQTRERIPLYNTPIIPGTPTGNSSQSIQNYLVVSKTAANYVDFVGASPNNEGQELHSVTLDFSNVTASSFTVTLNGTFSGKTSEERTDTLTLRVRVNTSTQRVEVSATTGQSWLKTPIVN